MWQKSTIVWASVLLMSVLLNIVLLVKCGSDADDVKEGHYLESLTEAMIQQASISWGDVGEFVGYLDQAAGPIWEVCAVIPPYACSQCISRSLQQLDELGLPVSLMVPEGHFAETLPPVGPAISVTEYSAPEMQNPVCFYPDLLFVAKEDGKLADFYLHDKEVPKAMAIFLYRVRAE